MAIQVQIPCSYYCMLVIVFIYQILVWKTRIRFVTTSICHKTTSAAKWLDPHPLNFTFANYQIRFFLPQDQCQITGFWLSRPSTWKHWQHMNVFLILQKCQYCFQAEEKCVTVTYHGTVRGLAVMDFSVFKLSLPTSVWQMVSPTHEIKCPVRTKKILVSQIQEVLSDEQYLWIASLRSIFPMV